MLKNVLSFGIRRFCLERIMTKLPFKAIAVDMDGTFLNSKSDFNRVKFARILKKLKQNNIHFIVASGNELKRSRIF
ncbi:hypothetical protein HMPREF0493_0516 [Lactobacillus amylolyticus DSM 11664]|uniref:Uncharacterized protein n=2 Tax=Lactobacillus amylolyticus TaxID=83683 RepID=D4YSN8_9LACO|nr:hypothetical protein HMPREF0493_0516 [Lactobacillus amylolyticus DSM 11664]